MQAVVVEDSEDSEEMEEVVVEGDVEDAVEGISFEKI